MEMNTASAPNAIDDNRQGLIGKPIDRVEGRLKVTGQAPYAHEVQEGGAPMSASIAKKVIESFQPAKSSHQYHLTERELEVLQLLTKGHSTKVIADKLDIAFTTVRSHLKNIYAKLHVNCGKEAIAKALTEHISL